MTDKINTSPEAVERLADSYVLPGMPVDCRPVVTAATLRALSARLAEVEAALATARRDALEEGAALVLDQYAVDGVAEVLAVDLAAAIRALIDKEPT